MRTALGLCLLGLSALTGMALAQDEGEPKGDEPKDEPSPGDVDVDALMKSWTSVPRRSARATT
jgi:hypothetical protein